jgi:hypothetical protein
MYIYIHVYIGPQMANNLGLLLIRIYAHLYPYLYMYKYIYMYIYVYVYIGPQKANNLGLLPIHTAVSVCTITHDDVRTVIQAVHITDILDEIKRVNQKKVKNSYRERLQQLHINIFIYVYVGYFHIYVYIYVYKFTCM